MSADSSIPITGPRDLTEYIDGSKCEVLNATKSSDIKGVLGLGTDATTLDSVYSDPDVDEQLLFSIPLKGQVKLSGIQFDVKAESESKSIEASAPKDIKIFINQNAMSFNDVDAVKPAQTLKLAAKDIGRQIPLKVVAFQNVWAVHIFFGSNQGETPSTFVSRIRLIGTPGESFDVSKQQKGGCCGDD